MNIEAVQEALDSYFSDTSRSVEETYDELLGLREHLATLMAALEGDM